MGAVGKRGEVVQVLLNAAAECDRGLHQERWVQQKVQNSRNKTQDGKSEVGYRQVGRRSAKQDSIRVEKGRKNPTREVRAGR
jgi:hypothetical protein